MTFYHSYGIAAEIPQGREVDHERMARLQVQQRIETYGPGFKQNCTKLKKKAYYINKQWADVGKKLRPSLRRFIAELTEVQSALGAIYTNLVYDPPDAAFAELANTYSQLPSVVKALIPGDARSTFTNALQKMGAYRGQLPALRTAYNEVNMRLESLRNLEEALSGKPMEYAGLKAACSGSNKDFIRAVCKYRNLNYRRMMLPRGNGFRGWKAACDRWEVTSASSTKYIDHPPAGASNWFPLPREYTQGGNNALFREYACTLDEHCGAKADFFGVMSTEIVLGQAYAMIAYGDRSTLEIKNLIEAEIAAFSTVAKRIGKELEAGLRIVSTGPVKTAGKTVLRAIGTAVAGGLISTMNPVGVAAGAIAMMLNEIGVSAAWNGMVDAMESKVDKAKRKSTSYLSKADDAWDDALDAWLMGGEARIGALNGPYRKADKALKTFKRLIPTKSDCGQVYPTRTPQGWLNIGAKVLCSASSPTYAPGPSPTHRLPRPDEDEADPHSLGVRTRGAEKESDFGSILTNPTPVLGLPMWQVLVVAGLGYYWWSEKK